ncbi:M56 family metallopeptidase [Enteractinococcus helveticum]|uniref:M56 family metallopeptidase n=1 Tax=Enteractinococcus helveticum TaxID=1837282 RepID=UPI000A41B7A8|nr:M56 family metallopeptidase [Enteractinococcus helveticum]
MPLWLQQAKWPSRAPGAALILWQAIGISGGLSLVTAPLTWGLQPFGPGILSGGSELWRVVQSDGIEGLAYDPRWHPLGFAAITLGCIIFGHLALVLVHTAYRTFTQRKKHREFVELLSASLQEHDRELLDGSHSAQTTRVLPVDHPLAYCLPGVNQPLTIVSQGLLDKLSTPQLNAVLSHEAAHLTQRHDLLRLAFQAWHKAAPWLPVTSVAVNEVTELTEILADDVALMQHQRTDLTTALVHTLNTTETFAAETVPSNAADNSPTSRRLLRLLNPEDALSSGKVGLVVILAVLVITVPAFISLM